MIYAPVLIPTLCRSEHFIRCIESLKKNTWAKKTDIYVALDYPLKEEHWKGYNKISKYLMGDFSHFAGFHVIKRKENYGSTRNMKELRDMILEQYDRFIRADDDCEFSPNFLEYMDRCLEYYENDKDVVAVTGYSYPVDWKVSECANLFKSKFLFSMWGTGFWRDKFCKLQEVVLTQDYLKVNFDRFLQNKKIYHLTQVSFDDYAEFGTSYKRYSGLMNLFSDRALTVYLQLENKYVITPTCSKVRNYGFDGTGVFCLNTLEMEENGINSQTYNYQFQKIDEDNFFEIHEDYLQNDKVNKVIINTFDSRPKKKLIKMYIRCWLYQIMGKEKYCKIMLGRRK